MNNELRIKNPRVKKTGFAGAQIEPTEGATAFRVADNPTGLTQGRSVVANPGLRDFHPFGMDAERAPAKLSGDR